MIHQLENIQAQASAQKYLFEAEKATTVRPDHDQVTGEPEKDEDTNSGQQDQLIPGLTWDTQESSDDSDERKARDTSFNYLKDPKSLSNSSDQESNEPQVIHLDETGKDSRADQLSYHKDDDDDVSLSENVIHVDTYNSARHHSQADSMQNMEIAFILYLPMGAILVGLFYFPFSYDIRNWWLHFKLRCRMFYTRCKEYLTYLWNRIRGVEPAEQDPNDIQMQPLMQEQELREE